MIKDPDDRPIAVSADIAKKAQLHTHKEISDGVMKTLHVEEGFAMCIGLTQNMEGGGQVEVTFTFGKNGRHYCAGSS